MKDTLDKFYGMAMFIQDKDWFRRNKKIGIRNKPKILLFIGKNAENILAINIPDCFYTLSDSSSPMSIKIPNFQKNQQETNHTSKIPPSKESIMISQPSNSQNISTQYKSTISPNNSQNYCSPSFPGNNYNPNPNLNSLKPSRSQKATLLDPSNFSQNSTKKPSRS